MKDIKMGKKTLKWDILDNSDRNAVDSMQNLLILEAKAVPLWLEDLTFHLLPASPYSWCAG
jgi:hypothetical protein